MVSLELYIDVILPLPLWPWSWLSLWQKWVPGIFSGWWRGPVRRAEKLAKSLCRLSWNLGASTFWKISRPVQGMLYVSQVSVPIKFIRGSIQLLTYLLTPWRRVLLEKLTGLQLVKKFPAFHGTRMFITALTSVRPLSLSWVSLIQSIYPLPTSWRSILILSTHLRLGLPSGLFLQYV